MNMVFEIRQGSFVACLLARLLLEQKNGQGPEQGKIARRNGLTDRATVLILGTIPAIVLTVFDAPMIACDSQQSIGVGFLGPESGHPKTGLVGFFNHLTLAHDLNVAVQAHYLRHAR